MMANLLTAFRLALIAPLIYGLLNPSTVPALALVIVVMLAIISDVLDGKVARARGTASPQGMLFDHTTDFVFVTSSMLALGHLSVISYLLPLLVIIAFGQYVFDSYYLHKQKQLKMSFLGKWNGVFYFGPVLLTTMMNSLPVEPVSELLSLVTVMLSYILIGSTAASIIDRAIAPKIK